jgi:glutathione S-transferase
MRTLYHQWLSPFARKVRIVLKEKRLDFSLTVENVWERREKFLALNPAGTVPVLVEDGTRVLADSGAICEYLEDRGLGPSLRPDDPAVCAKMRLIARISDLYVMDPMGELFGQINPAGRDPQLVARELAALHKAMAWLEHYLEGPEYAVGGRLTLADCELVPVLFFFREIGPMFGQARPFQDLPRIEAYYASIGRHPAAARVLGELDEALKRMTGG